ncbi:Phosphorylated carbohydrates phosphatase [Nymphaea thermarum]|nr:Phosphorylated carbohydrates phosphatase [Nymphaea thermarum]
MDTIAAAPLVSYRPVYQRSPDNLHVCYKDKMRLSYSQHPMFISDFSGRGLKPRNPRVNMTNLYSAKSEIRAFAMELTKEARSSREGNRFPGTLNYVTERSLGPKLWLPPNKADDPSLANPLLRQERMGCGWLGVIFEMEGVIIEESSDLENRSWLMLAQEEGKQPPPGFILRRIEGMKNEQAISEVLCWSRDPVELRRMGLRKEEIYQSLHGGFYRLRAGSQEFALNLMKYKIPMALVSTRPRNHLEMALGAINIANVFAVVVAADDVHRGKPDPEMFSYASQLLNLIPERCIVFGNSNSTVEAAHDAKMKCIAVAGKHPMYELGAADLVVRRLDELSIVDLKNLADIETEFEMQETEVELEEDPSTSTSIAVDFW